MSKIPALACALVLAGCGSGDSGGSPDAFVPDPIDQCVARHVIFLNASGGTYSEGATDSRMNTIGRVSGTVQVPGLSIPQADWTAATDCIRETFAPYAIEFTFEDPGAATHIEVLITSASSSDIIGDGTWTSIVNNTTCQVAPNGLPVVFASTSKQSEPMPVCREVALVVAQVLALDKVAQCPDVMADSRCDDIFGAIPAPSFIDDELTCSSGSSCPCGGGSVQNSHQAMLEIAGPACDE